MRATGHGGLHTPPSISGIILLELATQASYPGAFLQYLDHAVVSYQMEVPRCTHGAGRLLHGHSVAESLRMVRGLRFRGRKTQVAS